MESKRAPLSAPAAANKGVRPVCRGSWRADRPNKSQPSKACHWDIRRGTLVCTFYIDWTSVDERATAHAYPPICQTCLPPMDGSRYFLLLGRAESEYRTPKHHSPDELDPPGNSTQDRWILVGKAATALLGLAGSCPTNKFVRRRCATVDVSIISSIVFSLTSCSSLTGVPETQSLAHPTRCHAHSHSIP